MPRVVVAVADAGWAGVLGESLSRRGFTPLLVFHAAHLDDTMREERPAAVVFTPELSGVSASILVGRLRVAGDALLIALVPRGGTGHGLLDAGAHMLIETSASASDAQEVVAQVAALLRLRPGGPDRRPTRWGPISVDLSRRLATLHGAPLPLTPMQLRILHALVAARGGVVSQEALERAVGAESLDRDRRGIAAHIRRLRSKIETDPSHPEYLLTVRGEGFRLARPRARTHELSRTSRV